MFKSSYTEEFKWPEVSGWGIKKWPRDRNIDFKDLKRGDPVFRNNETCNQLSKECLTPFNYLLQPKPIIETDPRESLSKLELPKDDGRARFTRPRVYKCPEISLDDINDPEIRDKIIDYTYSTTWGIASKDSGNNVLKREIPNAVWEPPDHVLFNQKSEEECELCKQVTDNQINEWDRGQLRALGDSTYEFWQQFRNENPLLISDKAVTDIKSPEITEKILKLAEQKKLRLPYDLKPIGYAGVLPECPMGIEPEKKELEISDPMITTYQVANRWFGH